MAPWLLRRLTAAGHIDPVTFATRRARMVFCDGCRHGVMRGLTGLPTPWSADCDPQPLSSQGEVLALLSGLTTYELRWQGDHYDLQRRGPFALRHCPAGSRPHVDVLAQHRCREPANWPTAETQLVIHHAKEYLTDADLPDDPPF